MGSDQVGHQVGDRRVFEDQADGDPQPQVGSELRGDSDGDQGVAAEGVEVVVAVQLGEVDQSRQMSSGLTGCIGATSGRDGSSLAVTTGSSSIAASGPRAEATAADLAHSAIRPELIADRSGQGST